MISDFNPKFMIDIDEFFQNNSLTALLQIDHNKIYFILTTVKYSFNTIKSQPSRFYPNPIQYYELLYEEKLNNNHTEQFFNGIDNIKNFILQLRDEADKK